MEFIDTENMVRIDTEFVEDETGKWLIIGLGKLEYINGLKEPVCINGILHHVHLNFETLIPVS